MKKDTILILDDETFIRELLSDILSDTYDIIQTDSGYDALDILDRDSISLALVDINMPIMNGIDFVHEAKEKHPDIAYLIISGNSDIDNAIAALHNGVWDFIKKPFTDIHYIQSIIKGALSRRNLLVENQQYKESLEKMVKDRTQQLEIKNTELIYSRSRVIGVLSRAAEYKDYETGQHFIRVSLYSSVIAKGLGLPEQQVDLIEEAAPVHDIGKIGIPEKILMKQGKLTDDEYREMQNHSLYGEEILLSPSYNILMHKQPNILEGNFSISDNLLNTAARIAKSHHERYNGSGYPEGLKGDEIPLEARIVAIADVYDALGTDRSYKKAWEEEICQEYIYNNSGILFDPEIVEAFLRNINSILDVKDSFMDKTSMKRSYI